MTADAKNDPADVHHAVQVQSLFLSASDGLRLHARDWQPAQSVAAEVGLPLVCLPGLARTAADFDVLAASVCAGVGCKPRRVIALDYRGRGLSEFDRNWRNYDMMVENQDILTALTGLGVEEGEFLGTSRGGLHLMVLAATRPGMLRRVILNDIGPVIEAKGLARIRGYVGKLPAPNSWDDAVDLCKHIMSAHFSGLKDADWLSYAQLTFQEKSGKFVPRYDTKLMKVLEAMDLDVPLPVLWPQFNGLRHVPMLVLRGEQSDLLSQATLVQMGKMHPECRIHVVAGQGHAPLLIDDPTIAIVTSFLAEGDGG